MTNFATQDYWINIDKPIGCSSAKIVAIVKRLTRAKKVGHGGTLDPFAEGVLPVAVNKATKTAEAMMQARKKYRFFIKWGEFRDTDDIEGSIEESSAARPSDAELISVLPFFVGKILQTPSKFSALKIDGKRAYELARKGVDFSMPTRQIEIFSIKMLSNSDEGCKLEIECSKGSYVRSLARDICKKLQVCGFVSRLTRLQVGGFSSKNKISLERLKNAVNLGPDSFVDGSLLLILPKAAQV